jgi:hypothetical protein
MAHYAFLNDKNIVTEVIAGVDEKELIEGESPEIWYSKFKGQKCVRTSYNGNIRKNYAGIGFTYDEKLDGFIPPKIYEGWILNLETCLWEPPIPMPENGIFYWNDELGVWSEIIQVEKSDTPSEITE